MKELAPVITIDGPSGVGKSLLCKAISKKLKWFSLESGNLYRSLALILLKNNNVFLKKNIINICNKINVFFSKKDYRLYIMFKGNNISDSEIMSQDIINLASKISTLPYVRKILFYKQKYLRQYPGVVTNGRDMGTVIFPDAKLKFFLDGELNVRVKRRMIELKDKGFNVNFKRLKLEMKNRDFQDKNRINSPLIPASNAIIIDSTNMSFKEVFNISMQYIKKLTIN